MEKVPQYRVDEELAFREEKENLKRIEDRIESIAERKKDHIAFLREEIDRIYVTDSEDLQNKQMLMEQRNSYLNDYDEIKAYESSPYFGHVDVASDEETLALFIGEKGLMQDGDVVILDWRAPMGFMYYNKGEHRFRIEGKEYELLLRRTTDIKNGTLLSVGTEYDSVKLSLEGEVIDPFLLSVLRDKRRNYKLTDIIRTIQSNQNDIIRKPLDDSFIVQGCAGSGKTMILLHRLSYLAFNYKDVNFNRFCIITPNDNFNLHIGELSRTLGLDQIKKFTAESFFAELINSRSREDVVVSKGKETGRFTASGADVIPEKTLSADMLSEIYSSEFRNQFISKYREKSQKTVSLLTEPETWKCISERTEITDQPTQMDFPEYRRVSQALEKVLTIHRQKSDKYPEAEAGLTEAEERCGSARDKYAEAREKMTAIKDRMFQALHSEIERIEAGESDADGKLQAFEEEIAKNKKEKAEVFDTVKTNDSTLQGFRFGRKKLKDRGYLLSSEAAAVLIREHFPEETERIAGLYGQLEGLAVYNFGRRARVRTEIAAQTEALVVKADPILDEYDKKMSADTAALRSRIGELDAAITKANAGILELKSGIKNEIPLLGAMKECLRLFETEEYPNLNMKSEFAGSKKLLKSYLTEYEAYFPRYQEEASGAAMRETELKNAQANVLALRESILDKEEFARFENAQKAVEGFSIGNLYREAEDDLRVLYEKYGETFLPDANYRHRLYLKLLLAFLYYGPAKKYGYYINIDEAQDFAASELLLIRDVLGDNAVFNLYGDVNQAIYEYKGISDWTELSDITGKVYFLNENYRNTSEITGYCNEKFDAEVTAIGLSGEPVKDAELDSCMNEIQEIHREEPAKRIAVIYKSGFEGIRRTLESISKENFSYGLIDTAGISVLTVDEAKGLEFDAVLVIDTGMTVNERYVAYTRALDRLLIASV